MNIIGRDDFGWWCEYWVKIKGTITNHASLERGLRIKPLLGFSHEPFLTLMLMAKANYTIFSLIHALKCRG